MSLASEPSSQSLIASVFLDSHLSHDALSQALLELNQCTSIYSGDLDAAAAVITHSVTKNLGVTGCQVWLYTDNRSLFKSIAYYGTDASNKLNHNIRIADYASYFHDLTQRSWLVVNTGESRQPYDKLTDSHPETCRLRLFPPYLQGQTITAFIEIPIYQQEQIIGVLCCHQQDSPRVWQAAEKSFMVTAAYLIALAVSHANNQQKTRVLNQQKRQLTLEMIERQQAEKAWQESQCFIQGILDASTNILYVNDFASGKNYYVNGYMETVLGYSPEEIQQFGAQFLEQLAHSETIKDIHKTRQRLVHSENGESIENEYRLRHKQGNWLWMLCRETIFQWNQDGTPQQLLGTATDITARKQNAEALQQQNQELTALARVDALTQIANRRAFDEFLKKAWTSRDQAPLTLILCDIDYFKLYNDTYGHPAGDACLRRVAQALQKAVKRQPDLVARYGGEEFAVVLPNTTLAGAQHVAQTIKNAVCELEIEHCLSTISNYVTVSLGIATVASIVRGSSQLLITAADQGLYQAKSEGRDRYAVGYVDIP